jgi:hypothetical protein
MTPHATVAIEHAIKSNRGSIKGLDIILFIAELFPSLFDKILLAVYAQDKSSTMKI